MIEVDSPVLVRWNGEEILARVIRLFADDDGEQAEVIFSAMQEDGAVGGSYLLGGVKLVDDLATFWQHRNGLVALWG